MYGYIIQTTPLKPRYRRSIRIYKLLVPFNQSLLKLLFEHELNMDKGKLMLGFGNNNDMTRQMYYDGNDIYGLIRYCIQQFFI